MPEIPYGSFLTPNEVFIETLSLSNIQSAIDGLHLKIALDIYQKNL